MVNIFHCYEFLLLRKLDNDPNFWNKLKGSILKENDFSCKVVPPELWFVAVTLTETKDRFPSFFRKTLLKDSNYTPCRTDCILTRYLQYHEFVEMHLDSIFKHSEDCTLPKEWTTCAACRRWAQEHLNGKEMIGAMFCQSLLDNIINSMPHRCATVLWIRLFKCPNLKVLSLKYNCLELLPPEIGKLQKLEYLALTNNKLQNSSIPYSLSFCTSLKILLLNNNLLDALPGFLLVMPNLNTVQRHGNHNYFKATFMWYHTDVNERILQVPGSSLPCLPEMKTLKELCAITIIGSKINFFAGSVPPILVDYICSIYFDFNLCYKCHSAKLKCEPGYKVYTFKNPYLGNTCVPFQHWACSMKCAEAIEVPAREEQLLTALEQDREYYQRVQEAQDLSLHQNKNAIIKLSCCIL